MSAPAIPWHQMHLLALDIESTGVDVFNDRIVTVSSVFLAPGKRPASNTWLIDPGVDIPDEAAQIHGWTTERVRSHPDVRQPGDALFELLARMAHPLRTGVPLVAFNAAFDLTMLEAECARHGVDPLSSRHKRIRVVDPFVIDREQDKYRKGKRVLSAMCEHYKVILAGAHSSAGDALAAARLVKRLCEEFPAVGAMGLDELHDCQVAWHRNRQADFARYLRRKGEDASDVNGEWPIRTTRPAAAGVA